MTKKITAKKSSGVGVGGAVAVTGVALAALGAYLLSGKEGEARQKKIKAWAQDARKEIIRKTKEAKKLGKVEYDRIVDAAVKRYGTLDNIKMDEVMKTAQELKAGWHKIKAQAGATAAAITKKPATSKSKKKTVKKKAK